MNNRPSVARALRTLGRPVFTTREIAALRGTSVATASDALARLERDGLLVRATRGIWCDPDDPRFTSFALVPFLAGSYPAYVSFLSALHLHGIIEQIPQVIYAATTAHTSRRNTRVGTYSFHRLAPSFFDGFDWYGDGRDFLIASPEKALVDSIYLSSRRGTQFSFYPELDLSADFSVQRAAEWVERIPSLRIRRFAEKKLDLLLAQQ